MPNWLLKAGIQKLVSVAPFAHWWNEQLLQRITGTLELTQGRFDERIAHCRRHLEYFCDHGGKLPSEFTVLEIGTGWHPVVAVAMFCCGAKQVWTLDVVPLLNLRRVRNVLEMFVDAYARGQLANQLPHLIPDRVATIREILRGREAAGADDELRRLGIHYLVRGAQATGLETGSIDLAVSVASLEYVPVAEVAPVLREVQRVLSPTGMLSFSIDLADQYAYFDRSITPFNFLQFSDFAWKCINNSIIPLNRLRASDYQARLEEAGFEIEQRIDRCGSFEQLQSIQLAERFKRYSAEDLAVLHTWLVARPISGPVCHTESVQPVLC
jgi:SAM-dependent methyltransferase